MACTSSPFCRLSSLFLCHHRPTRHPPPLSHAHLPLPGLCSPPSPLRPLSLAFLKCDSPARPGMEKLRERARHVRAAPHQTEVAAWSVSRRVVLANTMAGYSALYYRAAWPWLLRGPSSAMCEQTMSSRSC
jgi:hypothetical protein